MSERVRAVAIGPCISCSGWRANGRCPKCGDMDKLYAYMEQLREDLKYPSAPWYKMPVKKWPVEQSIQENPWFTVNEDNKKPGN